MKNDAFLRRIAGFFLRFSDGFAVTLPLLLLCTVMTLAGRSEVLDDLVAGRLYQDLQLEYPVYADMDGNRNMYVIDHKSRRIVCIDSGGYEVWSEYGSRRSGGFYETYRLAALPRGGVAAYNFIMDPEDGSRRAEEVVLLDGEGKFQSVLVHLDRREGEGDDERIGSFMVRDGQLLYFLRDRSDLILLRRSLDPGDRKADPSTHETVFRASVSVDWVSAVPYLPQGILLADRTGDIWLLRADGTLSNPAFAPSGASPVGKPWILKTGGIGDIYILDNRYQRVFMAPSIRSAGLETVFSAGDVSRMGLSRPFFEGISFQADGSGVVVDKFNNSVYRLDGEGSATVVSAARRPLGALWLYSVRLVCLLAFLPLGIACIIALMRRIFARRTSLIVKQVALFLPMVVLSVSVAAVVTWQLLDARYRKELHTKLELLATLGTRMVDGDLVGRIEKASDFGGEAHRELDRQCRKILAGSDAEWSRDLRIVIYKYTEDCLWFVRNTSNYYGVMFPYGGASRAHYAAARGGSTGTVLYSDEYGSYLGGLAPIRDSAGTISGVFEVYHNYSIVEELGSEFLKRLAAGVALAVLMVIALLATLDLVLFLTLGYLRNASCRLMDGELGILVRSRRNDEIGDLARDFNIMSGKLSGYFDRLRQVQSANDRFVPRELVQLLGKDTIAGVESGDQIRRNMTLFFADIRSFTSISEGLGPKENFDFVNRWFGLMGPLIRSRGGFVERYVGDALMAVFPESPVHAVEAARDMRKALAGFNAALEGEGMKPVEFGVGIHSCPVILGVVGEPNRLSVTVVSEGMELVGRLEGMTKSLGSPIIMSHAVWEALPADLRERCRPLGKTEAGARSLRIWGWD